MSPELRRRLDRIFNRLHAGRLQNFVYLEQVSYLIYLKILDEAEGGHELGSKTPGLRESLFPHRATRYRWSEWRLLSGNELLKFVRDEVFPYIGSLIRDEPDVAAYFQDARLEIDDPQALKDIIEEIDQISFAQLSPDVRGDVFEYLLLCASRTQLPQLGEFRTPPQIRKLMVGVVDPDFGDTIYDPACGTGGLVVDTVGHILAKHSSSPIEVPIYGESWLESQGGKSVVELKKANPNLQTYWVGSGDRLPEWRQVEASLFGNDVSPLMVRIARMNLLLHGFPHARIRCANSLSDTGGLTEDDLERRYQVILSNPPFAGRLPNESIRGGLPTNSKKSEMLFLALIMQSLAPGGRCATIVPEGLLFGSSSAHIELRRTLVTNFKVQCVVSLSADAFKPYVGVKTSILIFCRPEKSAECRTTQASGKNPPHVWFYDLANDGFRDGRRLIATEKNDIPEFLERWHAYKKSGFNDPWGPRSMQRLPADFGEPKSWWATVEEIERADWMLSANRYKPQLATAVADVAPHQLINEALDNERILTEGLKKLLEEIGE